MEFPILDLNRASLIEFDCALVAERRTNRVYRVHSNAPDQQGVRHFSGLAAWRAIWPLSGSSRRTNGGLGSHSAAPHVPRTGPLSASATPKWNRPGTLT